MSQRPRASSPRRWRAAVVVTPRHGVAGCTNTKEDRCPNQVGAGTRPSPFDCPMSCTHSSSSSPGSEGCRSTTPSAKGSRNSSTAGAATADLAAQAAQALEEMEQESAIKRQALQALLGPTAVKATPSAEQPTPPRGRSRRGEPAS